MVFGVRMGIPYFVAIVSCFVGISVYWVMRMGVVLWAMSWHLNSFSHMFLFVFDVMIVVWCCGRWKSVVQGIVVYMVVSSLYGIFAFFSCFFISVLMLIFVSPWFVIHYFS